MQHMDWNGLRIFLYVARQGNLVNAARALRLDPTTVSRRISALESGLQNALFERTKQGFALTAYGRALLPQAEAMELAVSLIERTSDSQNQISGPLRVSVSEGFGTHFIAPRLVEFTRAHPQVSIDMVASSGFLSPSKREADLAILLARPRQGPLKVRKLTDYALGLYAPSTRLDWHQPAQLVNLRHSEIPVVGYIPDFIYAPELRYLDEIEAGLEASVRCSSINAQREMIGNGVGIGVLPCFMAVNDPRLTRVRPDTSIQRSFWLAVHRDLANVPRVRKFIDWLVQIISANDSELLSGR